MKKLIAVCLMICAVYSGYAKGSMAVLRNGDVFKVIYKCESPSNVQVIILDAKGVELFREELRSSCGFVRPYNFSELPKGSYRICIKDEHSENAENINYKDDVWPALISQLPDVERKILVAVPKQDESDFSLQIFDNNNQLVYSEDQKTNAHYGKVFLLKGFESGASVHLVNHKTGEVKTFRAN